MSNDKLAEIRKLAVRLQTAAYDHGGIDASDRWSAKKYADADDRSRAALTTLMDAVAEALQAHAAEAAHPQPAKDASKYQELLMAVEKKFPGESRHDTALRYIRQAELRSCEPKCDSSMAKESGR